MNSKNTSNDQQQTRVPPSATCGEEEALAWMGPPPVFGDEDPGLYKRLRSLVAKALQPADILGWFLVDDVAYNQLQIDRLRRASDVTINRGQNGAQVFGHAEAELNSEDKAAHAVRSNLDVIERLDRMVGTKESRRNRAVQEADRRRALTQSSKAPEEIDGDIASSSPKPTAVKAAA